MGVAHRTGTLLFRRGGLRVFVLAFCLSPELLPIFHPFFFRHGLFGIREEAADDAIDPILLGLK